MMRKNSVWTVAVLGGMLMWMLTACGSGVRADKTLQTEQRGQAEQGSFQAKLGDTNLMLLESTRVYMPQEGIFALRHGGQRLSGKNIHIQVRFNAVAEVRAVVFRHPEGGMLKIRFRHSLGTLLVTNLTEINPTNNLVVRLNFSNAVSADFEFVGQSGVSEIAVWGRVVQSDVWKTVQAKEYLMPQEIQSTLDESGNLYEQKNYKASIASNLAVLQKDPLNPYANMNLGELYMTMSKNTESDDTHNLMVAEAVERLKNADIPENPRREVLLDYLASVYRTELLDSQAVVEYRRKAIDLDIALNGGKVTYSLVRKWAALYHSMSRQGGTKKELEVLINDLKVIRTKIYHWVLSNEVRPNDGLLEYAVVGCAFGFNNETNYQKAIEIYRLILKKFPDVEEVQNGHVYKWIAVDLMRLGKWQEAIEAWKGRINKTASDSQNIAFIISYCYLQFGKNFDELLWYSIGKSYELYFSGKYKKQILKIANKTKRDEFNSNVENIVDEGKFLKEFLTYNKILNP